MKNRIGGRQSRRTVLRTLLILGCMTALCRVSFASDRDTYKVKNAFRNAVHESSKSTVRVLCDGQRTAAGAVVGSDGYVLTKASELRGDVMCQLFDGRRLDAKTVGTSEPYDLALLKMDASGLPTIQWREGDSPAVGSWVATTGLGSLPVSVGIVSVSPRKIERRLPALGVILEDSRSGPRVYRVVPDSGASKAGVREGDVVIQLDGEAFDSRDGLIDAIRTHRPGDKITLRVRRDDKEVSLQATLGEFTQLVHGSRDAFQNSLGGRLSDRRAGFPMALQHDSVLSPDQCGGPLVDLDGKVVGINIARASRVSSYAIPASQIRPLLEELKTGQLVSTTPTD